MRKGLFLVGLFAVLICLAPYLWAGGIINKQNLSADYIRTLNRNASADAADAAVFNPAGTTRMENGMYLKADAIYFYKDYTNKLPSTPSQLDLGTLDSEEPSIIPGLFALYKQDRWSAFFAVTIPGGGGKVRYDDGNSRTAVLSSPSFPTIPRTNIPFPGWAGVPGLGTYLGGPGTNPSQIALNGNAENIDQFIEADSYYIAYTFGGAFRIIHSLSISGGVRYVDAYQKFKGKAEGFVNTIKVKIERTDEAWNYFLGLDYAPIKDLNFSFLYMANTPLNFKADTKDNSPDEAVSNSVGWADGTHEREDLPGYLAFGASYFIISDKLRIEPNFTYYLEKQAKLEGSRFDSAGNSWDAGITLEYIFNPQWKASIGYLHTDIRGMKPEELLPEAPELDANTISLGVVWSPLERLSLTLSGLRTWYDDKKASDPTSRAPAGTELDKDVWGLAFGIQYRFF